MRALVLGSHGFIGEHLCTALERKGYRVVRVPRTLDFDPTVAIDASIFNLAAYGNYHTQTDEGECIYVNIGKLYRFLEMLTPVPIRSFINISSSSVMLKHQTFYSATKMGGEYIVRAWAKKHSKPAVSVRPFSVTGPGEQGVHLIPSIISSIDTGRLYLDPDPVHDYIDVRDLVRYLIKRSEKINEREHGLYFEAGSGRETSNLEVLQVVESVAGRKIPYTEMKNTRVYDQKDGWSARQGIYREYRLRDSVHDMYEEYRLKKKDH